MRAAKALLLGGLLLSAGAAPAAQDDAQAMWKLAQEGKVEEAIALAEAYLDEHPGEAMAHHNLGRFFFLAKEYELAVEELTTCLELGPPAAWATAWSHNVLGQSLAALGETERALEHLRRAVEMDATANCTRSATQALAKLGGESPWGRGALFGKPLPEFAFSGLAGEMYRREDFAGVPVLLRFGTSW